MSRPPRPPVQLRAGPALLAIGLLLSALAPAAAQDSLGRYRFETGGQVLSLASVTERAANGGPGSVLVSLRELVTGLGGTLKTGDATGERFVTIAGTALRIPVDQPSVLVGAERVMLSRAARRIGGDLYLPIDFLTKAIVPILEPAGRAAAAAVTTGAAAAPPATPAAATAPAPATKPTTSPLMSATPTPATPAPASAAVPAPGGGPTFTVVIDPGHGGTETGAEGKKGPNGAPGLYEKDVTLDIARSLKRVLAAQPNINVLLTRDDDAVVALDERTALANQNHADLFVSIHVNSAPRRDARGAETYVLSYASKDEDVRTLAAMENNAAGVDKEKLGEAPEGLELVLWDLAQSQYLQESSGLAGSIQKELNEALGARNRGVRQAPFRVLMGATMPAVLVEVGFISNPTEESSLATAEYRDKIAQALSRAVTAFLADAKRRMGAAAASRTR